jgi:hypothetical protein
MWDFWRRLIWTVSCGTWYADVIRDENDFSVLCLDRYYAFLEHYS